MYRRFRDRSDAGHALAERLAHLASPDCIVLALPRGGLPVAYEVARALGAPLDVLNVRKLGVPSQPELAMGAVSTGGVRVLNEEIIHAVGVSNEEIELATETQRREIERREQLYRGGRPAPVLAGRTVILVDDGIATGATIRAAITVVRAQQAKRVVVGTPVAAASTVSELSSEVEEIVSVLMPANMFAIGLWYEDFPQLTDADVQAVLAKPTTSAPVSASQTVAATGEIRP